MDLSIQALVLGLVQGLTEFLPISSSGHLILVPAMLGWHDPFIGSLAFSVMLHMGTLAALLVYFWADWRALVPAGLALLRDRSTRADPDRRLALVLMVTVVPAALVGVALSDFFETQVRAPGLVALMFVVGAAALWLAERWGARRRQIHELGLVEALGIGAAQAVALVPGISRSGISIAGGLLVGLTREASARFSFLMATPVIAGAGLFEALKLARGEAGVTIQPGLMVIGVTASFLSGIAAIHFLLRWLRANSTAIFVAYRILAAGVVALWLLGLPWR